MYKYKKVEIFISIIKDLVDCLKSSECVVIIHDSRNLSADYIYALLALVSVTSLHSTLSTSL